MNCAQLSGLPSVDDRNLIMLRLDTGTPSTARSVEKDFEQAARSRRISIPAARDPARAEARSPRHQLRLPSGKPRTPVRARVLQPQHDGPRGGARVRTAGRHRRCPGVRLRSRSMHRGPYRRRNAASRAVADSGSNIVQQGYLSAIPPGTRLFHTALLRCREPGRGHRGRKEHRLSGHGQTLRFVRQQGSQPGRG